MKVLGLKLSMCVKFLLYFHACSPELLITKISLSKIYHYTLQLQYYFLITLFTSSHKIKLWQQNVLYSTSLC